MNKDVEVASRPMGRPKKAEKTVQFTLVLPPDIVQKARRFKFETGQTISQIAAKAILAFTTLTNFFSNTMNMFQIDNTGNVGDNAARRTEWAKTELARFEGVKSGLLDFIKSLESQKSEYAALTWEEARTWHTNDVEEQINRVEEDIQLNERRMTYYRNIIAAEGKI